MSDSEYKKGKELILGLIKTVMKHPNDLSLHLRNEYAHETMTVWDSLKLAAFKIEALTTLLWSYNEIKKMLTFLKQHGEFDALVEIINGNAKYDPQDPNVIIEFLKDPDVQKFIKENEKQLNICIKCLAPHCVSMIYFKTKKLELGYLEKKFIEELEASNFNEVYIKTQFIPLLVDFIAELIKHYPEVIKAVESLPVQKDRTTVDPWLLRTGLHPIVVQTRIGETSYHTMVDIVQKASGEVPMLKKCLENFPLQGGPGAWVEVKRKEQEAHQKLMTQMLAQANQSAQESLDNLKSSFDFLNGSEPERSESDSEKQESPNNSPKNLGEQLLSKSEPLSLELPKVAVIEVPQGPVKDPEIAVLKPTVNPPPLRRVEMTAATLEQPVGPEPKSDSFLAYAWEMLKKFVVYIKDEIVEMLLGPPELEESPKPDVPVPPQEAPVLPTPAVGRQDQSERIPQEECRPRGSALRS